MVLYVRNESPYKTAQDIIDEAKKNPGKQRWGCATVGSVEHMIAHQIQQVAKINVVPSPLKAAATCWWPFSAAMWTWAGRTRRGHGEVEAKKVRILANFTAGRLEQLRTSHHERTRL
jgi:tripartite-type tricarboxylate transporter receptor subunit TctC